VNFDCDTFKAKNPLRDISFWVAVITSIPLLIPVVQDAWANRRVDTTSVGLAIAPITAWLVAHGYVRGQGAAAYGKAAAVALEHPVSMAYAAQVRLDESDEQV
jgi:hypothetical protein